MSDLNYGAIMYEYTSIAFFDGNYSIVTLDDARKKDLITRIKKDFNLNEEGGVEEGELSVNGGVIWYKIEDDGYEELEHRLFSNNNLQIQKEAVDKFASIVTGFAKEHNLNYFIQVYGVFWTTDENDDDTDGHIWYFKSLINGIEGSDDYGDVNHLNYCEETGFNPIVFEDCSGEEITASTAQNLFPQDLDFNGPDGEKFLDIIKKVFTHPYAISVDQYEEERDEE